MSYPSYMVALNRTRGTQVAERVRTANTHWTRLRGLMCTSALQFPSGDALWIVPCHGVHTLAMRFPLDLIYLDRNGKAVELLQNVQPWRLAPLRWKAASVLELREGAIRHSHTENGDHIEIGSAPPTREDAI